MQILRNMSELDRFSTVLYGFVRFCTVSYGFVRFPTFVFFSIRVKNGKDDHDLGAGVRPHTVLERVNVVFITKQSFNYCFLLFYIILYNFSIRKLSFVYNIIVSIELIFEIIITLSIIHLLKCLFLYYYP